MNVSLPSYGEQKNEIELSLARTILTQLEQQKISYEESQDIARFILAGVDNAPDHQSLLSFLQTLVAKWPVFESTYGLYRLKVKDELETQQELKDTQSALAQMKGAV